MLLKETSFPLALLWPWVGEEVEHFIDFTLAKHKADALTATAEIAKVFRGMLREFFSERVAALKSEIHSNKIGFRIFLAILHHEFAVARSNLNTKWSFSFKNI